MKPHPFDPFSFVAGLVVTGLGVLGATGLLADVENLRLGWPLVLVVLGGLLIASTIRPRGTDGDDGALVDGTDGRADPDLDEGSTPSDVLDEDRTWSVGDPAG